MTFMSKMFSTRGKKTSRPVSQENLGAPVKMTKYNSAAPPAKPSYKQQVTKDVVTVPPRHKSTIAENISEAQPEKVVEKPISPLGESRVSQTPGNGISCGFHHVAPGIQMNALFSPKMLPKSALPTPSIGGPQLGIQAPFQYQTEDMGYHPIEIPEPKLLRSGALTLPKLVPFSAYSQPVSVAADIPVPADIPEGGDYIEEGEIVEEKEEPVEMIEEEAAAEGEEVIEKEGEEEEVKEDDEE